MKARGYIAIDRGIFSHRLFRGRPERLKAWQWLIAVAAWRPENRRGEYGTVHIERGQLVATMRTLAATWHWPKSNVDRFLKRLEREGMVRLEKTGTATGTATGTPLAHQITIITLCNYEKFQGSSTGRKTKPGQQPGQQPGQVDQQALPLIGIIRSEPSNHLTKDRKLDGNLERGKAKREKPRHEQRSHKHGTVWIDVGTVEWNAYATDYQEATHTEPLPQRYPEGAGRWFSIMGEAHKHRYPAARAVVARKFR